MEQTMEQGKGKKVGLIIFWITFVFCGWIMWYISTAPPGFAH